MVKNYYQTFYTNINKCLQYSICVFTIVISLCLSANSYSQTDKSSTSSGDWTTINWSPNGIPSSIDNAVINTNVIIPIGTTVEINDLRIASNGILIVNGNLKVKGNLTMDNNAPEFIMGNEAIVGITGNFIASNKIDISISSYLIIQGDFIKSGSGNQGNLDVDNGNIYIFGDVDGFPELTSCNGTYDGTTTEETDDCDYGAEDDYINNQDTFPPEVQDLINCFDIDKLDNVTVCSSSTVTFTIDPINEVTYQWQIKENNGGWVNIAGEVENSLTILNTTVALSGNKYRVVINATASNPNNCKIGLSNFAVLTVKDSSINLDSIIGEDLVCPSTAGLIYSIPIINDATIYSWVLPSDWSLETGQNTNSISVISGNSSGINILQVSVTNSCGAVATEEISINIQDNIWNGAISTDWNTSSNWSCNTVPSLNTNVIIKSGLTNYPILNSGANGMAKDLELQIGTSLTVMDNTMRIAGSITNTGTINSLSGTIAMEGVNSQTIPANTFVSNRIRNLIINNNAGVNSNNALEITGFLRAENGQFNTGNLLSLISNSTQTALIDGSGNGQIVGSVKMQRYLDSAIGYKYFSSPFNNTTVGDFSSYVDLNASFPQVYSYSEDNTDGSGNDITGWKSYNNSTFGLGVLEGYTFNFGTTGNAVTVELNGTVNNGYIERQLKNTNGTYTKGFNLIGNPYPSPIDWDASSWTKTNIDDGIYFFSANSQYKGTYTSYVNNVSSDDGGSSNIIPSMQGFFVHVSDGGDDSSETSGILASTNEVRVNNFTQQFIKKTEPNPISLIRLSAGIKDTLAKDAMVIYFDLYAEEGFEKDMDALKLMNTDERVPNLYSITSKSEKLSINALPASFKTANQRIPLGIRSEMGGEMSIRLKDIENLPSNFFVYLIDDDKRIGQNLSEIPEYNFRIKTGEHNSRFFLMFSEYELTDPALAFDEPFSIKTINGEVYVNLNLEDGMSGVLMATTVTGQILDVKNVAGNETTSLDGIKSSGIYFINLSWEGKQFSKKIMIQK